MIVIGEHFTVSIRELHKANWVVLELTDKEGRRLGCRWHIDASRREIATSLLMLADKLNPDTTKI